MLLGHRVGVVQLAAQGRPQLAVDLLGRAVGEHVVGGRDVPRERVGRAAELLLDEEPLDVRPALAAVLARVQAAGEPARERLAPDQRSTSSRAAARPSSASTSRGIRISSTNARARSAGVMLA